MRKYLTHVLIQNGEVNFIVEVEPNDVVDTEFDQQQPNLLVTTPPSSSSLRKGTAVRPYVALQGRQSVPSWDNSSICKLIYLKLNIP